MAHTGCNVNHFAFFWSHAGSIECLADSGSSSMTGSSTSTIKLELFHFYTVGAFSSCTAVLVLRRQGMLIWHTRLEPI
uniref:Uncharacterized protein n=1 Tax=Anguilla anguilla TaxID=7936 RepID=A0A0E9XVR3_ANGAN